MQPPARAGHSSCVYEDKMYVFGGKDEDNEKLKDFWCFDFATNMWDELRCEEASITARSGHSVCVYDHHMIIFAGIHEITKELEDMASYSFKNKAWTHMFKAQVERGSEMEVSSPTKFSNTYKGGSGSPMRLGPGGSPTKIMKTLKSTNVNLLDKSSPGITKPAPVKRRSPKKQKNKDAQETEDIELQDPTSVTLMNSFLIKSAGSSFENFNA